jgi:hypothetical protein
LRLRAGDDAAQPAERQRRTEDTEPVSVQPTAQPVGDRKLANRYGEIRNALRFFDPSAVVKVSRQIRTQLIAEARKIRALLEAKGWTFNHRIPNN